MGTTAQQSLCPDGAVAAEASAPTAVSPAHLSAIEDGAFEWYSASRRTEAAPACSVTRSGVMTLSHAAAWALGFPVAVQLGYNAELRQLALRPASPGQPGALALRRRAQARSGQAAARRLSARHVLCYFGILPGTNRWYSLEEAGDGVFALSLDHPQPE